MPPKISPRGLSQCSVLLPTFPAEQNLVPVPALTNEKQRDAGDHLPFGAPPKNIQSFSSPTVTSCSCTSTQGLPGCLIWLCKKLKSVELGRIAPRIIVKTPFTLPHGSARSMSAIAQTVTRFVHTQLKTTQQLVELSNGIIRPK